MPRYPDVSNKQSLQNIADEMKTEIIPDYKVIDWFEVSGRGWVAMVDLGKDIVKVGDKITLDSVPYTVQGVETQGYHLTGGLLIGTRKETDESKN